MVSDRAFFSTVKFAGESIQIETPREAPEYQGELSDFPAFTRSRRTLAASAVAVAPDVVILMGWHLVLLTLGLVAFSRYDVR